MRVGRLPEIFCNEDIIVAGANSEYESKWKLSVFADTFPFTEVIKVIPINKNTLRLCVYDATARALAEKRYEDVHKYAEKLEHHIFNDDMGYIEIYRKLKTNDII